MHRRTLLERYEATGDERYFHEARTLYEQAMAEGADAEALLDLGYLLEGHGRNELRRAAELYERAIALDPGGDKAHYQLISARVALRDSEDVIATYERRLAAAPDDVRQHRFLATAYVLAGRYAQAARVIEAGLALAPIDNVLIANRGETKAGLGDPDGALADWRRAVELDREDIGPLFSIAFLLEREDRLAEALDVWHEIARWHESRGLKLHEWVRQLVARLEASVRESTA